MAINKQLSHATLPFHNLTSHSVILNCRARGGKTLLSIVICVLLCTLDSVYLSLFCLFYLLCTMYTVSEKISKVILMGTC